MTAVRRERNPLLCSTVAERTLTKGVSLAWGIQSVCVCRSAKLPGRDVHNEKVRGIGRR